MAGSLERDCPAGEPCGVPATPWAGAPAEARPVPPTVGAPPTSRDVRHSLGPILVMTRVEHRVIGRLYAAGIGLAVVAILVLATRLTPNGDWMGTHRQLGLPPCGFVVATGYPCPTCGMTTAFALAVRGRFLAAARAQVAGCMLFFGVVGAGIAACWCVVTGCYPAVNWYRVDPARVVWLAALVLVGAWALTIGLGLADGSLPVRWPLRYP